MNLWRGDRVTVRITPRVFRPGGNFPYALGNLIEGTIEMTGGGTAGGEPWFSVNAPGSCVFVMVRDEHVAWVRGWGPAQRAQLLLVASVA